MDGAHDLIFAILAAQMGIVTREQLTAVLDERDAEQAASIREIVIRDHVLQESDSSLLDTLANRLLEANGQDFGRSLESIKSVGTMADQFAEGTIADQTIDLAVPRDMDSPAIGEAATIDPSPADPDDTLDVGATVAGHRETRSGIAGTDGESMRRFRIIRPHAEGGIGKVSLALDSEIDREVALKEIKPGHADNLHSRARFLLEAKVTGRLEHPGIVPVYGLGHDEHARPYYAMRFIKGDSLQQAIEKLHSESEEEHDEVEFRRLLRRFIGVCEAMHYAHTRGVIHRDLKPDNVMLCEFGETLVVDWGLAKVRGTDTSTDEAESGTEQGDDTIHTQMGSTIGTPSYMSPEQASGQITELGPGTDIYSLGATLYCILTGRPPVVGTSLLEVLERVQEGDVADPSQYNRSLPRSLVAICRKALAHEVADRYASAQELADDLERFFADEPVHAHTEPILTRARRWLRKHPKSVASLTAGILVGLTSLVVITAVISTKNNQLAKANQFLDDSNGQLAEANRQLVSANAAETKAKIEAQAKRLEAENAAAAELKAKQGEQAVAEYLVEIFRSADPQFDGPKVTLAEILDRSAADLQRRFKDDAETKAVLLKVIGQSYLGLGMYDKALPLLEQTLALRVATMGDQHEKTLHARLDLAYGYRGAFQYRKAISTFEAVRQQCLRLHGANSRHTLSAQIGLGSSHTAAGEGRIGKPLLEDALERCTKMLGEKNDLTRSAQIAMALAYQQDQDYRRAIPFLEAGWKGKRQQLGKDHPHTLSAMHNLATTYSSAGQFDKAIGMYEENVKLKRTRLGADHPQTLMTMRMLAHAYHQAQHLPKALPLFEETLRLSRARLGNLDGQTLATIRQLGLAYQTAGDLVRATPLMEEAAAGYSRTLGPKHEGHYISLTVIHELGIVYLTTGKFDQAAASFKQAWQGRKIVLGEDQPHTLASLEQLANATSAAGKHVEAVNLLELALKWRRKTAGDDAPETLLAMQNVGAAYASSGHIDKAISMLQKVVKRKESLFGRQNLTTVSALVTLGSAYHVNRMPDKAIPILEECLTVRRQKLGDAHADTMASVRNLVLAYEAGKRSEKLVPLLKQMIDGHAKELGADHNFTISAMHKLGDALLAIGQPKESLEWHLRTLERRKQKLGANHAETLTSLARSANGHLALKQVDKALELLQQLIQSQRRAAVVPANLSTALSSVAQILHNHDRHTDAEPYLRESLGLRKKHFDGHWIVHDTQSMLGAVLTASARQLRAEDKQASDKKLNEAEKLLLEAFEGLNAASKPLPPQAAALLPLAARRLVALYALRDGDGDMEKRENWSRRLQELRGGS